MSEFGISSLSLSEKWILKNCYNSLLINIPIHRETLGGLPNVDGGEATERKMEVSSLLHHGKWRKLIGFLTQSGIFSTFNFKFHF